MRVGVKSTAVWALPLAVVIVAIAVIATDPGGIATRIRGIQFDAYQYLHKRPYVDPRAASNYSVRVLDLGGAATARFGAWPLSHAVLARLVLELRQAGAPVVLIDAPLGAPDKLSPQLFARTLAPGPQNDAARQALSAMPSPDAALAGALASVHAVSAFTLSDRNGTTAFAPKTALNFSGSASAKARVPAFAKARMPLAAFAKASAGLGARNLTFDPDGKLRAMPLLFRIKGKLVPSLDAEAMRLVGGAPLDIVTHMRGLANIDEHETIARLVSGKLSVPLRPDGAMEVYYSGPNRAREISAIALDDGKLAAGSLAQTIVVIAPPGRTVATPLGPETVGDAHAEALENMLLGMALIPAKGVYAGLVFVFVVGLGMSLLMSRAGLLWTGLLAVAAIAAAQSFTWALFTDNRTLFDSLNPSLALALAFLTALMARSIEIARTRGVLREAFAGALPPATLDKIAQKPSLLKIEGETRTVTCLSCGVRGYAQLAESFMDDPVGFTRLMSTLMTPLLNAATSHGAMIECAANGGFTAYWNAPLDDPEHAIHTCEAANRMTVALAEVNEQLSRERRFDGTAYEPIEIGIGISTGRAVTGGFGARGHTTYSVTGDCTLMAERIRKQSGQYGPAIIVADDTRKAAERGFAFLEVDFLALGPRDEPVKLYAMLGNPLVRASPKFRALATFHEHIFQSLRTQQWDKTKDLIDQCRKLSGASQKLYDLHLARIAYFEQNPPGSDWDGAFRPILK